MDTNILKNNGIDISSGIEILGDIDTYNDILKEFADNFPERLSKIEEYKNTSDMENYAIEVHAMKGDSKYLGFTKLADLALNHQLKSQDGDIDYINNNIKGENIKSDIFSYLFENIRYLIKHEAFLKSRN